MALSDLGHRTEEPASNGLHECEGQVGVLGELRKEPPGTPPGPPLLVTVEEAASLLRLGRTRTYEFIRCGAIQSVKVGRRRLVVRASLELFVNTLIDQADLEDH